MDHRFFFEVPPFEELQDPDSSPRREEVGRRTPRDYGGFLLPFFYRARFRESTSTTRKRQARNIYPNKTPITSGVEESDSPRRVLLLLLSTSSGGRFLEKKHVAVQTSSRVNKTLLLTRSLPRKSEKLVKVGTRTSNGPRASGRTYPRGNRGGETFTSEPLPECIPPAKGGPWGLWANTHTSWSP